MQRRVPNTNGLKYLEAVIFISGRCILFRRLNNGQFLGFLLLILLFLIFVSLLTLLFLRLLFVLHRPESFVGGLRFSLTSVGVGRDYCRNVRRWGLLLHRRRRLV